MHIVSDVNLVENVESDFIRNVCISCYHRFIYKWLVFNAKKKRCGPISKCHDKTECTNTKHHYCKWLYSEFIESIWVIKSITDVISNNTIETRNQYTNCRFSICNSIYDGEPNRQQRANFQSPSNSWFGLGALKQLSKFNGFTLVQHQIQWNHIELIYLPTAWNRTIFLSLFLSFHRSI